MASPSAPPRLRWVADARDLIAHAYPPHGRYLALCGQPPFESRWARPSERRCPRCEGLATA